MNDITTLHPVGLTIHLQTPHRVPIRAAQVRVIGGDVEVDAVELEDGVYELALPRPGDYQLVVERFQRWGGYDHRTLRTTLFYVYTAAGPLLRGLSPPAGERSGVDSITDRGGGFVLGVTLDYLWFTPVGYPPTYGNRVDLLVDGDVGWTAVANAIQAARASVHVTTWMYDPDTELERPLPLDDPPARERYTIHELLAARASSGVRVRFLGWNAPVLRQPAELRRAGAAGADEFEVLEQANPTAVALLPGGDDNPLNDLLGNFQVGSYHQKTVIIDGALGFCGGMNLRENDWDSRMHRLFDPRRCRFSRDAAYRRRVERGEASPDNKPRHDFMARIEGPAVEHLARNFQQRWNFVRAAGGQWSRNATEVVDPPALRPIPGGSQVQVVRTMPEPFAERGILDVHLRALRTARRLIYIEDQYFRSTHVSDAIADTVRAWPDIAVVVVTLRSQADNLLSGGWSREAFDRIARRRPGFELHTLMIADDERRGGGGPVEVDNHAKLMIVDDLFLTVGSCNINDRGFEYEGEINVAEVDPERVRRMRLDIWREHLGEDPRLTGDIAGDVAIWREHAEHNRGAVAGATPLRSHVVPFVPRADRRVVTARDLM